MITSCIQRSTSFLCTILFLSFAASVFGQNERITHRQESEARGASPVLGRDLWFCVPLNYDPNDKAEKYFTVYATSEKKTVINIQISGQAAVKKQVNPGEVWDYLLPKELEIRGSLDIEKNKAVHVWSEDADLSVYFMSRNPFTSDGMYVIPTIGWGKEYVIASYSALIVNNQVDLPSEFCVVANQNNTVVTIIPSQDVRRTAQPSAAYYKKGSPFTVTLQRGECVQFQTVFDLFGSELDFTGTVVTANNPVGVIGASVCPFIPADPYCDHILDMLPPVRTWASTYYTLPFFGRVSGGDSFYLIGSKAGQEIFRNGNQYAVVNRFESYYRSDITEPSVWTSDAPFLLVQYINSSRTGGTTQNQGDPAMVVVNGAEHFAKKVVVQTPLIKPGSSQNQFSNFINVLVRTTSIPNTTIDGKPIMSVFDAKRYPIPGTGWEGIRLGSRTNANAKVPIGTHTILSDSGVGVYLYGYATEDSYAWAGALGVKTPGSPDDVPPVATTSGQCFCARVDFSDNHITPPASKLSSYIIDTIDNIGFYPDTNFIPGSEASQSYYEFCVLDSTRDAYLSVSIYDNAGNRTTVISEYKARVATITPPITNFGTVIPGNSGYDYVIITNTGTSPFTFKASEIVLLNGQYFFVDSTGADGDIPPGGTRKVRIRFTPAIGPTVQDTVLFGDECVKVSALVVGNGGSPDFLVFDYDFSCSNPTILKRSINFEVLNPSGGDVTINSVTLSNPGIFGYDPLNPSSNTTPFIVPKQNLSVAGKYVIEFTFTPPGLGTYSDTVTFIASDPKIAPKKAILRGRGCAPQIIAQDSTGATICNNSMFYRIPIRNVGNIDEIITSVTGTATATEFSAPALEDALGVPITLPYTLVPDTVLPSKTIYAVVTFTPPFNTAGTFTDVITVTNAGGDTVTSATVVANALFPKAIVQKGLADFGTQVFGAAKVEDFITICNDGDDPLDVIRVDSSITSDTSFSLSGKYQVGGVPRTLPTTLQAGECLDIYITFDPSVNAKADQRADYSITTTACSPIYAGAAKVIVSSAPPSITGFDAPATLSCSNNSGVVKVFNDALTDHEVIGITFGGVNPTNFAYTGTLPISAPSKRTTDIPIRFLPNAAVGTVNYSAYAILELRDTASGATYRDSAMITGIGQSIDVNLRSVFADLSETPDAAVQLPVTITVDKKGLTVPLDILDIRRIELSYEFNTDLLDIENNDIVAAVTDLPAGWTVDLAGSTYDEANDRLNLALVGVLPLPEGTNRLCNINFRVTLTKQELVTDFRLVDYRFLTGANAPVGACMTSTSVDSNFTVVLRCGDASLQKFMRDGTVFSSMIEPASPNPVTNDEVKLSYAIRFEGNVTLTIFDELGKEVLRIVDHERLPAGVYETRTNVRGLAPATYTYRLEFDRDVKSGRFVITR